MKFTANRESMLAAMTAVSAAIPGRSVKPVLQRLRLTVGSDAMADVAGTDLEIAIMGRFPVTAVGTCDVTIPPSRIIQILQSATSDDVAVTIDDNVCEIRHGSSRFKVAIDDAEEYPETAPVASDSSITIGADALRTLIAKTAFACAKERTRFAFNGAAFGVTSGVSTMAATDGKRMAVKSLPVAGAADMMPPCVIPSKGLAAFTRALRDAEGTVTLGKTKTTAALTCGDSIVTTRLVEGTFPAYESVIPKKIVGSAKFSVPALVRGIRQASILTNDESRSVRFAFVDGMLVITSRAVDVGEARVEVECEIVGTPPDAISFNPDYMLDGLKSIAAEEVTLRMSGQDTPALIEGEVDYTYLVMPVTLRTQ